MRPRRCRDPRACEARNAAASVAQDAGQGFEVAAPRRGGTMDEDETARGRRILEGEDLDPPAAVSTATAMSGMSVAPSPPATMRRMVDRLVAPSRRSGCSRRADTLSVPGRAGSGLPRAGSAVRRPARRPARAPRPRIAASRRREWRGGSDPRELDRREGDPRRRERATTAQSSSPRHDVGDEDARQALADRDIEAGMLPPRAARAAAGRR